MSTENTTASRPAREADEVEADSTPATDLDRPLIVRDTRHAFSVHALFKLPDFAGVGDVAATDARVTHHVNTTYYDTEDLRLSRWGATLSRTSGGNAPGWLLRLPDGHAVRQPAGRSTAVPKNMRLLVTALVRRESVHAVATLSTDRSITILLDATGEPVAAAVDDLVSVLDGDQMMGRYREVSLDAITDGVDLTALADAIVAAGGIPTMMTDALHALGPAATAAPDVAEANEVSPKSSAGEAVRAHLATNVRRLLLQDARVRADLPDAIHQMRVAARRIRSGLGVFGPIVDPEWSRVLRAELGWLAGELGLARDTEVLMERLDDHAEELDTEQAVLARTIVDDSLRGQLEQARTRALEALDSERYLNLLEMLVEAAATPVLTPLADKPSAQALPPLVTKAWERLRREVGDLHLNSESTIWHDARITAKKARYAAEAMVPVFGSPAKKLAAALSEVTEVLGTHQDSYFAQQTLRNLATDVDGPTGFALGLLYAREMEHELIDRVEFQQLWPQVRATVKQIKLG